MKNMAHRQMVPAARPSWNSCTTGTPGGVSAMTKRALGDTPAAGSRRRMSSAMRSRAPRTTTRKRIDSGRKKNWIGRITSGSRPPIYQMMRQPCVGMRLPARLPAMAAPKEKPVNMIITRVARRRSGQYSAVSAMALGMAPPKPRPERKRNAISCVSVVELAAARVKTPKIAVEMITTQRRPILSAMGPKTSAPTARPTRPIEMIHPI